MAYVVKMPKLGLEMEQGTVLEWYVEEGEHVEEGDVLLEVESEKSIGEVEAREDGVLRLLAVGEDETVTPGTPIGIVAGEDETIDHLEAQFDDDRGTVDEDASADEATDTAAAGTTADASETDRSADFSGSPSDVKASPRAEQRAEELSVDLASVDGSGPGGAVTAEDVEAAGEAAEAEAGSSTTGTGTTAEQVRASPRAKDRAAGLDVDLTTVEGTGPQGAITAEDVEQAADADAEPTEKPTTGGQVSPSSGASGTVTSIDRYRTTTLVTDGAEANALIEATALASEAFERDVSVLDVLLVATSATLSAHPAFNATLEDDTHHCHEHQHVALAAGEGGPDVVVENVTERSFAECVAARQGRNEDGDDAGAEDGSGAPDRATFVLGADEDLRGSLELPTVAGLAVDASRRRAIPAADGAGVSLSRYLSCSLSYDPRAVGDADARAFLETLCESIERAPELLLRTYR